MKRLAAFAAAVLFASSLFAGSAGAGVEPDHPQAVKVRALLDAVAAVKGVGVDAVAYEEQKTGLPVARVASGGAKFTALTTELAAGRYVVALVGEDRSEGFQVDDGVATPIPGFGVTVVDARMDYDQLRPIGAGGKVRTVGAYRQQLSTICHLAIAEPFVVDWLGAAVGPTWAWCDGISADIGDWVSFYIVDVGVAGETFDFGVGGINVTALKWCNVRISSFWYITGAYAEFHYLNGWTWVDGWSVPAGYLNCI